ncbi:MAG: 30S ribosomal protein S6 [Acidimicrobiales bacterium]
MRAYELMVIFDAELDDASVQKLLNRITEMIEADRGSVATVDKWGRRRFAYEINHKLEGYYIVLQILTEATNLDGIERFLRIADEAVRHKVIRLPEKEAARRGLSLAPAPAAAG